MDSSKIKAADEMEWPTTIKMNIPKVWKNATISEQVEDATINYYCWRKSWIINYFVGASDQHKRQQIGRYQNEVNTCIARPTPLLYNDKTS